MTGLNPLADITLRDISCDLSLQAGPPKVLFHLLVHLRTAGVHREFGQMSPECSRCISNHSVVLHKHTTKFDSRSITLDVKRFGNIWLSQNWGSSKLCSEGVECIFTFLIQENLTPFFSNSIIVLAILEKSGMKQ
jgi:hypothetical protein